MTLKTFQHARSLIKKTRLTATCVHLSKSIPAKAFNRSSHATKSSVPTIPFNYFPQHRNFLHEHNFHRKICLNVGGINWRKLMSYSEWCLTIRRHKLRLSFMLQCQQTSWSDHRWNHFTLNQQTRSWRLKFNLFQKVFLELSLIDLTCNLFQEVAGFFLTVCVHFLNL